MRPPLMTLLAGAVLLSGIPALPDDKAPPGAPAAEMAADGGAFDGMGRLLDEAVKKLGAARNREALDLLEQRDYPAALTLLKQAADLDPENSEIANNLGYVYYLLGNFEEAEKHLRQSLALDPERFVAYINLADMLGKEGESVARLTEAASLLKKVREIHGNRPRIILRQARVARRLGSFQDAMRFYREYVAIRKPSDRLLIEIGDFFREMGKDEEAFGWYQQVTDADEWGKAAATRIFDIEVERQAKKYGWSSRSEVVPEKANRLVQKGQKMLAEKQYAPARHLFEEAIGLAPGYSPVRMYLGDLLKETGKIGAAEVAYLRALALDSGSADIYVRLGELYLGSKRETRYIDAALFIKQALELRPDWTALHLTLAKALQGAGELDRALRHLDLFLAGSPPGSGARQEANRLKKTIEKLLGDHRGAPRPLELGYEPSEETAGMSEELLMAINRARAHLSRGRPDAAMAELRRLPDESRGTLVLNLEARILHASGRLKQAVLALRESLSRDSEQPGAHEQLGNLLEEQGAKASAREHYRIAEAQGNTVAKFYLARLDATEEGDALVRIWSDLRRVRPLLSAKARLESFLESGKGVLYQDDAIALRAAVLKRLWLLVAVFGGGVLLLGVGVLFGTRRLWGGVDVTALLSRHPDSGPEVQRVLSAIRHEVLKHNAMALGGVIESLERGGPDAMEKVRHFRRTLLGNREDSVPRRLQKYADELSKIGLSYGMRLNLKQKEPAIRLLQRGFSLLARELGALDGQRSPKQRETRRLLRSLKQAFRLLNVDGYEAVQQMLGRIRMLEVDESMIRNIAVRVLREPGFADVDVAPLALTCGEPWPIRVLISQRAFEDIFANLIRNALQSSVEMKVSPVEIGICTELEIDEVTGYERIVFLVCDHSEKRLTTEMIRGQAIEGGLGLTADLVSRYDGTMDVVEGTRGWAKAVRVKLPMAPLSAESGVT